MLGALFMVAGLGLVPALIVATGLSAGFAKLFVRWRRPAIIDAVLRERGVPTGTFNPAKFIVD
jgi:hypothetical protein